MQDLLRTFESCFKMHACTFDIVDMFDENLQCSYVFFLRKISTTIYQICEVGGQLKFLIWSK